MRSVGGGGISAFQSYSYGLGSLQAPRGAGGDALRTSILGRGLSVQRTGALDIPGSRGILAGSGNLLSQPPTVRGLSVPRTGLGSTGAGLDLRINRPAVAPLVAPLARPATALQGGTASAGAMVDFGNQRTSIGDVLATQDETAFGAARAYLQALEEAATSQLKDHSKPITSLVPTPPSEYRNHMAKGDRAFRANNFHVAYTEFQIAGDMGGQDPESLICLTHTQFALSRYSYAKACYFLQLAIRHMPELPLARLRPRGFYSSASKYAEHLVALEEHLEKDPADGEAQLLLAYFRWFGEAQDAQATGTALSKALASALRRKDTHLLEAAETFWDGMVASGKVSGKLSPPSPTGTSARPGRKAPSAGASPPPPGRKGGSAPGR